VVAVSLDRILTIKGEKKTDTEDKQGEFYSRERSYGEFQRSFEVPETIDENKIDASFSNGVLKVKMPKTPEAKKEVKKILINN
jgi:HSP20 family protein